MRILPRENEAKLEGRLLELGSVGLTPSGLWRAPFTPGYERAVTLVSGWMRDAGLDVRRDTVGNLIGRAGGREQGPDGGRVVAVGSHLDTVRDAGRYDGALGVLGGLLAVSHLVETKGPPARPIEVIAFTGEESSRFPVSFLGSRWMTGSIEPGEFAAVDDQGMSLGEAMADSGFEPPVVDGADGAGGAPRAGTSRGSSDLDAYLELHIEQGPVLEDSGRSIGVVSSIVGQCEAAVTVRGRAGHAGTVPMRMRRDALVAAVQLIGAMNRETARFRDTTVFTVGKLAVRPGSSNVIPGEVSFTVDLRDPGRDDLVRAYRCLRNMVEATSSADGIEVAWQDLFWSDPVPCDSGLAALLARSARAVGEDPLTLPSGAGHDAQILAGVTRVGMVFVPSAGGRSHCPEEYTTSHHCYLGAAVLAEALRELAY